MAVGTHGGHDPVSAHPGISGLQASGPGIAAESATGGTVGADELPGLEGRWAVRRVAGLIPPMIGVTKHITASSGVTAIARIPIARFDVRGNELRYRPPFRGVVDKLEPAGDQWLGQTLIAGTSIGRFRLVRDD